MTQTLLTLCKEALAQSFAAYGFIAIVVLVSVLAGWWMGRHSIIDAGPEVVSMLAEKEAAGDMDEDEDQYNQAWNGTEEYPDATVETIK